MPCARSPSMPASPWARALICSLVTPLALSAGLHAADLPQRPPGELGQWRGAQLPRVNNGGRAMTIEQFADRATLEWQSFDIGAGHSVRFEQPSDSAIALNRVIGDAIDPSRINGELSANGRVYLINQNGILFGPDANVDVNGLIASSLDIDDRIFEDIGIVNAINEATPGLAAFEHAGADAPGDIVIEQGAQLGSDATRRIMVFAPRIENRGEIRTPEGQAVLAAATDKVFIAASPGSNDLRGLLVEVNTGGSVENLGSIIAERGNVSILGMAVNQKGVVRATTSVSLGGSVRLAAQDTNGENTFLSSPVPRLPQPSRGGELRLGEDSVTESVPELDSNATAPDSQRQPLSDVSLVGKAVRVDSGARITSTGGRIGITAAADPSLPRSEVSAPTPDVRLEVAPGAVIDASGDETTVASVSRNIIEVEARGNELADSPLQRDGPIRNQTLQIDVRKGTDFLNFEAAAEQLQRGVGERLSAGGSVNLRSEGAIDLAAGAIVDISGGKVTFTPGEVTTSKLVTLSGQVVDIADANPDREFAGVLGDIEIEHEKWGVTERFRQAPDRFESGYVQGTDAGSLLVQGRAIQLDATLIAGTETGRLQRRLPESLEDLPSFARPFDQRPQGGRLNLQNRGSGLPPLLIGETRALAPVPGHPESTAEGLTLSAELLAGSGLSNVTISNPGRIVLNRDLELPPGSVLNIRGTRIAVEADVRNPGGTVSLSAEPGLLVVPGSEIAFRSAMQTIVGGRIDTSGLWTNDSALVNSGTPAAPIAVDGGTIRVAATSDIVLEASSVLDVGAGALLQADGRFEGGSGGRVELDSGTGASAQLTSALRVDGELRGFGFETGGALTVTAEQIRIGGQGRVTGADAARLTGKGQLDNEPFIDPLGTERERLVVAPGAFGQGGFQSYELTARRNGIVLDPDVRLELAARSLVLDTQAIAGFGTSAGSAAALAGAGISNGHPAELVPSGTAVGEFTRQERLPEFVRKGTDLSLNADLLTGSIDIGTGSRILADPEAAIALSAAGSIFVDGVIEAPAGRVTMVVDGPGVRTRPEKMLWLGPAASIAASGATRVDPANELGLRLGEVLDAGTIVLEARQGSLLAVEGSSVRVDAVATELDIGPGGSLGRQRIAGAGGRIELITGEAILFQGSLGGAAASASTPGGELAVTLDASLREIGSLQVEVPATLRGPHTAVFRGFDGVLPEPGEAVPTELLANAFVPVAEVAGGGFHSLDVTVRSSAEGADGVGRPVPDTPDSLPIAYFPEDLELALARRIAVDAAVMKTENAQVRLDAPLVRLGFADPALNLDGSTPEKTSAQAPIVDATEPLRLTPTVGPGTLSVEADMIELVGELVTQGFGQPGAGAPGLTFTAAEGLRLRGKRVALRNQFKGLFRTASDTRIEAGRIYPTTLTEFSLAVEGEGGLLEMLSLGPDPSLPLSVGGALRLSADKLFQGGVLMAPLGELVLDARTELTLADGSLTATSGRGVAAPFFRTQPGGDIVLPDPDQNDLVFVAPPVEAPFERSLPQQQISLGGDSIDIRDGATFDVRGGADVRATEFVPGPGGSRDILAAELETGEGAVLANPSFAIVPGIDSFAPHDPLESPQALAIQGIRMGDTIVLEEGIEGLPAGEHAILPPRYALFGGFLVTPQAGTGDLTVNQQRELLDGTPVLAGRFAVAGNDTARARSQGFAVRDGAAVRERAEFRETSLDTAFEDTDARLPRDAGNLTIAAESRLSLLGQLIRDGDGGGRGSTVDIASTADISIVAERERDDRIELLAPALANLGADSLLVGGTRSLDSEAILITPTAGKVEVLAGVETAFPELILTAADILVESGAKAPTLLASSAAALAQDETLLVNEDAAVLAVSNRRLRLERAAGLTGGDSTLAVDGGSTVAAAGSLILDAVGTVSVSGDLQARGGTLSLGSSSISLGETGGRGLSEGLILSNDELAALAGSDLLLKSRGAVSIFGDVAVPGSGEDIVFERLSLDAPAIRGLDNASDAVALVGDTVALTNSSGVVLPEQGLTDNGGSLALRASELVFGGGGVRVQGFGAVTATAGASIPATGNGDSEAAAVPAVVFEGDSDVLVESSFTLDSPLLVATQAVDARLRARGALSLAGGDPSAGVPARAGAAGALTLSGASVSVQGRVLLPSGRLAINQVDDALVAGGGGDLVIGEGAVLEVSGRTLDFGPKRVGTPGGDIRLVAESGDVRVRSGALLDVSGTASGAPAGRLTVSARSASVSVDTGVTLLAGGDSGEFAVDARSIVSPGAGNAVQSLNAALDSGGFQGLRDFRVRDGDISLAASGAPGTSVFKADNLRFVADRGSIEVTSTLDASGADGGAIFLAAGDSIRVSGRLDARGLAAGGAGGRAELVTLDADGDDPDAITDFVDLLPGAELDVSGGGDGKPGEVLLLTRRIDTDADQQTDRLVIGDLRGSITGAGRAGLVATRVLRDPDLDAGSGAVEITATQIDAWRAETESFVLDRLAEIDAGALDLGDMALEAGLQVESSGDIVLAGEWDLFDGWHFAEDLTDPLDPQLGVVGVLGLRAAGSLVLEASLTDAFSQEDVAPGAPGLVVRDGLSQAVARLDGAGNVVETLVPRSWSYRLVAGADQDAGAFSADPLAVRDGAGDLTLGEDVVVRTGTGAIELVAGRDVRLSEGAAVYTAGWSQGPGQELTDALAGRLVTADVFLSVLTNRGQFPVGGGRLSVRAGGDLVSTADHAGDLRSPTQWQPRLGEAAPSTRTGTVGNLFGAVPSHIAIAFDRFVDGVGALGGGDLEVAIGGDIIDMTLAMPATARATEDVDVEVGGPPLAIFFPESEEVIEFSGGGRVVVDAGGDFRGGQLHLGRGLAEITVAGATGQGGGGRDPLIFAGPDARVEWRSGKGTRIEGIVDPATVRLSESQVELASLFGINNPEVRDVDNLFFTFTDATEVNLSSSSGDTVLENGSTVSGLVATQGRRLPPTLRAISLGGDVLIDNSSLSFFPSPNGQLELLAQGDVTGNISTRIFQSDQDATQLPSAASPVDSDAAPAFILPHALVPVHIDDDQRNLIVAREGSITSRGAGGFWAFDLAKASVFQAGTDISNVSIAVQNVNPDDVSAVIAGRDIFQETLRDNTGNFDLADRRIIEVAGPGSAQFVANRRIALGTSRGIETIGDRDNRVLADTGAGVLMMAGLGQEPAYEAFIDEFLVERPTYREQLGDFLGERGVALGAGGAVAAFRGLARSEQRLLLADIFLAELRESGIEAQASGSSDFSRGFSAIDTLFPAAGSAEGGISMLLSQVQTLDGGGIEMLVPNGDINAGAAAADVIDKAPADLGIVAAVGGDIGIFVDNDLLVNSTRVFALQGDLMVWSSNGSIDAGRGAKTVASVPDPITTIGPEGETIIEFPPAIEGSGLQGENVFLFAPRGVVNAGDAGIRATGNLTVGATEILGADNIDVGGISVGVPTGNVAPPPAVPTQDNVAARATEQVVQQAVDTSSAGDQAAADSTQLSIISVEVLGFGS